MESRLCEVVVNGKIVKYESITVEKDSPESMKLFNSGYSLAVEVCSYGSGGTTSWTYIKILF